MPSIEVHGTTLHVVDEGPRDAPAVVLGHSLFFDHTMFDALAADLAADHRVVRYDHRGQGASARASRDELDMDTLTEDAAALIEELGLAPCTYLGNSMGGFVALRLAARRADLVSGVVVAGSSADAEERVAEFDPLVTAMGDGGVGPVLDVVTHIMLGDTSMGGARPELLEAARTRLAVLGPDIADAAWQVVHRQGVLDELDAIEVPVVVLAGAEDHAYPVPKSEQIAAGVRDAQLEVVQGVGHSVALEDPARTAAAVRELVSRTAGAAAR